MRHLALIALTLALLAACSDPQPKPAPAPKEPPKHGDAAAPPPKPKAPAKVEAATVAGVKLHKAGGLYLAGQPSAEALEQLRDAGVKAVINLRDADELKSFDESAAVAALGLKYHNPSFSKPDELGDPIFDRVRDLLRGQENTLLHCASGSRAGAVWLAYRVLDEAVPYDQALAEAKAIGLKSDALEKKAKDYIEANRK